MGRWCVGRPMWQQAGWFPRAWSTGGCGCGWRMWKALRAPVEATVRGPGALPRMHCRQCERPPSRQHVAADMQVRFQLRQNIFLTSRMRGSMTMTKASDLFVQALEAEGVDYVFGIPGEETLALLESLRTSGIRLVLTRHEQAAGFMAATWGRLTGTTGVCLATLGPGATNLVTAAAYAQLGAMPMMMITGQKPIRSGKQGHFQIVDVVDMMRPLTKYTRQLVSAGGIPAQVREAVRRSQEERPGATHLELPQDVASEDTDAIVLPPVHSRRPLAEHKALDVAADAIRNARHPLLMIGAGANRKTTAKMLHAFVEKLGIPFFSTQMGKGVLDETGPLWLGTAALSDGDFVHRAIELADCIVNVGHDVIEKPPFWMKRGRRTVIHVNYSPAVAEIGRAHV